MKEAHRKLNVYFFGEEEANFSDQVVYYGVFVAGTAMLGLIAIF